MQHLLEVLASIGVNMDVATVAVGVVTAFLTQGAKYLRAIPINDGQTARIRTFAAVLAFGGTFLTAWANGDIASATFTQYLGVVAQSVVTYFLAHITYKSVILDPNK